MRPSLLPLKSFRPSGVKQTRQARLGKRENTRTDSRVARFQSRIVWSELAEARVWPSGENLSAAIHALWPASSPASLNDGIVQSLIFFSVHPAPVASIWPSGLMANAVIASS